MLGLSAQEVTLDVQNKDLKATLLELKVQYKFEMSFDDLLVSNCIVSQKGTFKNVHKALEALASQCELEVKQHRKVFVLSKKKEKFVLRAELRDQYSGELLPFSFVELNDQGLSTDQRGRFSYISKERQVRVKASHLGYYELDTILAIDQLHSLVLKPSVVGLNVVEVRPDSVIVANQNIFNTAGQLKLNEQISSLIPGSNDKLLFNLLRLQSGVLAAGEHAEDFIIWGSYHGQTQLLLDGMTLFNTAGLNNDIGSINQMMIQEIDVHKGGYNVNLGDRSGALIDVRTKAGDFNNFGSSMQFNNEVVSGLLNIPINSNLNIQIGGRNTYYNTLRWNQLASLNETKNLINNTFQDLNIKVSTRLDKGGELNLSILSSNEKEFRNYLLPTDSVFQVAENLISQRQNAASLLYAKPWRNGGITNVTLAATDLESNFTNVLSQKSQKGFESISNNITSNSVAESSIKLRHIFPSTNRHALQIGFGLVGNSSSIEQDSLSSAIKSYDQSLNRLFIYVKDQISFGKNVVLEPGLRVNNAVNSFRPILEERLRLGIRLFPKLNLNAAIGQYDQYVSSFAAYDQFSNSFYYWSVRDSEYSPLRSYHRVLGLAYSNESLEWKIDAFTRRTQGVERLSLDHSGFIMATGLGLAQGWDFFLKKKFKRHYLSFAYTLSKSEENFDQKNDNSFSYAPHDQRHELKGVIYLNFKPFFISTNYVYGSGIPNMQDLSASREAYNRFDIAAMYAFELKNIKLEAGASVLNAFNTQSVRYNPMFSYANYQNPVTNTLGRKPMVFLNIEF